VVLWFAPTIALVTIVALIAEQGAVSDRIRNPNVVPSTETFP
jgi:hypothetical protein